MNLTLTKLNKMDLAISDFFEKIDRKGRIARRLRRAMDKSAKYLRPKVNLWLENMKRRILRDLTRKFAKDVAMDITTELTDWEWIQNNGKETLKPAMLKILGNGANEAFVIAGIEARFDVLNPRSVAWAEKHCAKLVREVTNETKKGIKEIIRRGIKEGKAMPRIAKEIRPLIGLTKRDMFAIVHFEERLIMERPELSQREIDRRVDVYSRRKHRRRADMISRTESAFAQSEGTLQGYREAGIEKVEWLAAADCCEECGALNGKTFKVEEASGMQPVHPLGRCCFAPI